MGAADRWGAIERSASRLLTRPQRYGWALLAVIAAALLPHGLDLAFGFPYPFILFYPTIMLISLLCGLEPSLLATAASATFGVYHLLELRGSFAVARRCDLAGLLVFTGMGVIMSVAGDLFRRRAQRTQEFEKAVEGLEEMIVVVDRDYRYLIANEAFLKYRGMKKEDLIGRRARLHVLRGELRRAATGNFYPRTDLSSRARCVVNNCQMGACRESCAI